MNNNFRDNINYSTSFLLLQQISSKITEDKSYVVFDGSYKTSKNFCIKKNNDLKQENVYNKLNSLYSIDKNSLCGKYYKFSTTLNIHQAFLNFKRTVGSSEIAYFVLSYLLADILDYSTFIFILNLFFLISLLFVLKKVSDYYKIIYIILLCSDFYLYVFLSELHRLKLSLIFVFLYYMSREKTFSLLYIFFGLISHVQSSIFYIYLIMIRIKKYGLNIGHLKLSLYILILLVGMILSKDYILSKLYYYAVFSIPYKALFLTCSYILFLLFFRFKETIIVYLPLSFLVIFSSFIVGENRLFFILLEYVLITELVRLFDRKYVSLIFVVPILMYNLFKSINFINTSIGLH